MQHVYRPFRGKAHRLGDASPCMRGNKRKDIPSAASIGPNLVTEIETVPDACDVAMAESQDSSSPYGDKARDADEAFMDQLLPSSNGEEYDVLINDIRNYLIREEKVVLVVQGILARIPENKYNHEMIEDIDDFAMGVSLHISVGHTELLKQMQVNIQAADPDDQYDALDTLMVDCMANAKDAEKSLRKLQKVSATFMEPVKIPDSIPSNNNDNMYTNPETPFQALLKRRSLSRSLSGE